MAPLLRVLRIETHELDNVLYTEHQTLWSLETELSRNTFVYKHL